MSEWTEEQIAKVYEEVSKLAATDKEFRELCLSDANKAVEDVAGRSLPANFTVRFVENEDASMTVVLPDYKEDENELSDAELEQVAGGKGVVVDSELVWQKNQRLRDAEWEKNHKPLTPPW